MRESTLKTSAVDSSFGVKIRHTTQKVASHTDLHINE